jgi:serine/threonine protein kinase
VSGLGNRDDSEKSPAAENEVVEEPFGGDGDSEAPSMPPSVVLPPSRKPAPSLIGGKQEQRTQAVAPAIPGSLWQSMQVPVVGLGVGEYEKVRAVGSGGQGTVWQVRSQDGTLFAQKEIRLKGQLWHRDFPKRLKDADREVRALKSLAWASSVVVRVIDCWINTNFENASIVMEWLPWTLGQILQERRTNGQDPPAVDLIRKWVAQLASGVAAIHAAGFIHRDLKPSNILMDESMQRCKITDLGVSRALHQTPGGLQGAARAVSVTNPSAADMDGASSVVSDRDDSNSMVGGKSVISGLGSILSTYTVRPGTTDYTSPEALRSGNYGPSMDIFSLGGVLFEILTLEVPPAVPLGEVESSLPTRAMELVGSHRVGLADVESSTKDSSEKGLADLGDLCISMVSAVPASRPTAKDIAQRAGIFQHTMAIVAESESDKLRSALGLPKQPSLQKNSL